MSQGKKSAAPQTGARGPDRLFALALQQHQAGRLADAEGMYRHILSGNPRHIDALHLLGVLALQSGRPQKAVEWIEKAIAINDRVSGFHNNIAEAYRALGQIDKAEAHVERALALEPQFVEAHVNRGNLLRQRGRIDEAAGAYRRAIELRPGYGDAHGNLGAVLTEQGKLDEALLHLTRANALKPNAPEVLTNLGIVLERQRKWNDAIAHHRQSLNLRPNHPATIFNLANALLSSGQLEAALAHYEGALRLMAHQAGATDQQVGPLESLRMALHGKRQIAAVEEECLLGFVRTHCWVTPVSEWRRICDVALKQEGLSPLARYELLVRRSIHAWIVRDGDLEARLNEAQAVSAMLTDGGSKNLRNSRAYANYLTRLCEHVRRDPLSRPADAALSELPIVGDSHCLGYDGGTVVLNGNRLTARAHLVMGCKAYHLADKGANHYKWLFERLMALPAPGSPVVLSFGEIDCRADEGILPHYKKVGGNLEALVEDQVERYVSNVAGVAWTRQLKLMLLGVPAPHLDALSATRGELSAEERTLLVRIIQCFNAALVRAAKARGLGYLDMYTLSARADGAASGEAHIDEVHLKPDALARALGMIVD